MTPDRWIVYMGGHEVARGATRQVAMNRVDRPYRNDLAVVVHETTGEEWTRRSGSWTKSNEARRPE